MHMYLEDNPSSNSDEVVLETNAFTSMRKLRLLEFCDVQLNGSYEEFPKGLRWLCWAEFPLDSLPSDFLLEYLVVLEMPSSNLRQVWKGMKVCYNTFFFIFFLFYLSLWHDCEN